MFVLFAFAGCKKTQRCENSTQDPAAVKPTAKTDLRAIMHSTGCTYSWGYWKTHGPKGCVKGNNSNTWAVSGLTIAGVDYTDEQLCKILQTSPKGNAKIALLHQLIGAMLNVANGASDYEAQTIADAESAIANNDMSDASALTGALETYNLGGPNGTYHCDENSGGGPIGQP